jgi:hypothetical protein
MFEMQSADESFLRDLPEDELDQLIRLTVLKELNEVHGYSPLGNRESIRKFEEACAGKGRELKQNGMIEIVIPSFIQKREIPETYKTTINFAKILASLSDGDDEPESAEIEAEEYRVEKYVHQPGYVPQAAPIEPSGAFGNLQRLLVFLIAVIIITLGIFIKFIDK